MDPYKELGVRPDASDEDIKRAYYALVKKYHPDKFANSPLKEDAQERLKRINIAYDEVQRLRKGGSSGGARNSTYSSYDNPYSGTEGTYTHQSASGNASYNRIRQLINSHMLTQAESLLDAMQNRDAEWYYLRGLCYFQRGWYDQASQLFKHAVSLDPGNLEYRQAVERMDAVGRGYRQPFAGIYRGGNAQMGLCGLCMLMQCLGGLCGRGNCGC